MGYILNQKSKAKTLDTLILQIYHFFTSFGSVLQLNIIAKVRFLHTKKRDCHHYDDNPVYTNYLLSLMLVFKSQTVAFGVDADLLLRVDTL